MSEDYPKVSEDYSKVSEDYSKVSEDYPKVREDYSKVSEDYPKVSEDYSKVSEDYPKVSEDTEQHIRFLLLSLWMKSYSVTIQMKAIEQYFPVVLFIMLYKVVLTFEFFCSNVYYAVLKLIWILVPLGTPEGH